MAATITYLTTVQFGAGAIATLPDEIVAVGMTRPCIVTDPVLARLPLVERIREMLPADTVLFEDTPSNPTEAAVDACLALYRAANCDGLIAIGGGSPIDLAKAVAVRATHEGPLADFALILGGLGRITPAVAPVIAVPTTAGTGSEVGRGALITLEDGRKLALISPHIIPKRAICDPELTLDLPPRLTAATGMDALSHCIETYLSPRFNPPAEAIALDGARRVMRFLPCAFANGHDLEARTEMMVAALHGGLTFQKGLGAVHAMSHPLGGLKDLGLHHGTLNAVILPAVLRFNEGHVGAKYDKLREAMGLPPGTDLAAAIEDLNARLGLPPSLRAMGVPDAVLPRMVEGALVDHSAATNPRQASRADYAALYEAAMVGQPA